MRWLHAILFAGVSTIRNSRSIDQALISSLDSSTSKRHFCLGSSQVCCAKKKFMESVMQRGCCLIRKKVYVYLSLYDATNDQDYDMKF